MATLSPPLSPQTSRTQRPRPMTTASVQSHRSWRTSSSGNKMDMTETAKDKRKLNAKSDPTEALREAQPAAIALEDSNLDNLRALQHKDHEGNVITDPDRSNPTRNRLERPLDTIRSFNAAAEGTAHRRTSYGPSPSPRAGQEAYSRRSSYYNNGYSQPPARPRPMQQPAPIHRNGSYGFRADPYPDDLQQQNIPYGRPPRQPAQQYFENGESPGPANAYGRSYETMTSGSEEYSKSTNPSSQNSSFDRLHQMPRKPEEHPYPTDNEISYSPPTPQSIGRSPYGQQNPAYYSQHPQQTSSPDVRYGPPPANNPRQPIKLNTGANPPSAVSNKYEKPLPAQKRQSWIKRTFSRRNS